MEAEASEVGGGGGGGSKGSHPCFPGLTPHFFFCLSLHPILDQRVCSLNYNTVCSLHLQPTAYMPRAECELARGWQKGHGEVYLDHVPQK